MKSRQFDSVVAVLGSVYITKNWLEVPAPPFPPSFPILLGEDIQWSLPDGKETSPRASALSEKHQFCSSSCTIRALYPFLLAWASEPMRSSLKCGKRRNAFFVDSGSVPFGSVFFNSECFRWWEGNRKNPQSLPYYSFLCKTRLADTAYSRW